MFKRILPLLVLPLLLAGCATEFTNLTAQRKPRETNNIYMIEVAVASEQQTMRWESIRPQILIGTESYPMQPTPLMTNRWEGVVPIPPGTSSIQHLVSSSKVPVITRSASPRTWHCHLERAIVSK